MIMANKEEVNKNNDLGSPKEISQLEVFLRFFRENDIDPDNLKEELSTRLMPKGYFWPRFTDGKKVCIGDETDQDHYGYAKVNKVAICDKNRVKLETATGQVIESFGSEDLVCYPNPHFLDCNKEEIAIGDMVYITVCPLAGAKGKVVRFDGDNIGHVIVEVEEENLPEYAKGSGPHKYQMDPRYLSKQPPTREIESGERIAYDHDDVVLHIGDRVFIEREEGIFTITDILIGSNRVMVECKSETKNGWSTTALYNSQTLARVIPGKDNPFKSNV